MSKRGPKPKYGEAVHAQVKVWVTPQQRLRLQHAAKVNLTTVSDLLRDAVESYVSDFSDDPMFDEPASAR
jgi:hypothetical protein